MFHRPGFSALNTDVCWAEYERVKEFLPVNPKHINVGTIGRVAFDDTPLSTCIKAALGDASLIWETFKDNPEVKFHRSPKREID
ncbi:hypothetical protein HAY58_003097 [Salmonella enterica]|nr:hypothetical protein [Salmonella enterica subsp. enterica serovar Weltevreden]EEP1041388.1 hypothetical protein [Salmonella enterica]ECB2132256.1 hypothetical protein [Salmonella enterica subsp. enterica serovar Weltevreden]EEP1059086.1 hypothetical protein [Salmonella enterica]EEP1196322.1 hypothetical protein [Salmonella enterica]